MFSTKISGLFFVISAQLKSRVDGHLLKSTRTCKPDMLPSAWLLCQVQCGSGQHWGPYVALPQATSVRRQNHKVIHKIQN